MLSSLRLFHPLRLVIVLCATGVMCLASATLAAQPEVSVVIGSLLTKEGGPNATEPSLLKRPFGVDFDSKGNMVIVELEGGRVHQFTPDGTFSTIAGDGSKSYKGDGGPLRGATFNGMHNVAIAADDTIYIADSWNHCIRKVDPKSGVVTTFAGSGKAGFSGEGGPAEKATFHYVMCITLDPANEKVHVADLKNRRIREVDLKTRMVRTVAGNGEKGVPKDGSLAVESPLVDPRAVAADSKGNIYVLERGGHALRVVKPDGRIYTVAGTGRPGGKDGPALQAQLNGPKHLCVDDTDRVYIADDVNHSIRLYDPGTKRLTRILGHGESRPPLYLKQPHGVCIEKEWLYVVDSSNDRILRMPVP